MARPPVVAVCLVLGLGRSAMAGGKTSKVIIETDPPGAKVYLGLKEDGEICTTPCTIDAPVGETPIIIEAENRKSLIENLVVPRKSPRPLRVQYKLKPALGTLVIEGGDGAAITIDEEDQGTAPKRFDDILAGAHHVVLERRGKKLYDGFVEVEIGREVTVSPPRLAAEPEPPADELAASAAARARGASEARRGPQIAAHAATDVAFRQFDFRYRNSAVPATQRNDREVGQVLTGAVIDLWPTRLLGLEVLPGLALHARFQLGLNPQRVTAKDAMTGGVVATSLTTAWSSLEISANHRWTFADTGTVEVGAGYADDRYRFHSDDPILGPGERAIVPDAVYQAVRIGVRASLLLGRFEPYLAAENRLVLSGGALEGRYSLGTSVNGVHGALGVAVRVGRIEARAEASLTQYSWTFRPDNGDRDQASSGTDRIEHLGLSVGYLY